jgi:hypothetical protein
MYEKLTPKEYVLEEQSNEEISSQKSESAAALTNTSGAEAVVGGKKGLFGGGLGGLFNQIGIEELLLIGLILLLVFEEGEFDIILVLAFLLICGLEF